MMEPCFSARYFRIKLERTMHLYPQFHPVFSVVTILDVCFRCRNILLRNTHHHITYIPKRLINFEPSFGFQSCWQCLDERPVATAHSHRPRGRAATTLEPPHRWPPAVPPSWRNQWARCRFRTDTGQFRRTSPKGSCRGHRARCPVRTRNLSHQRARWRRSDPHPKPQRSAWVHSSFCTGPTLAFEGRPPCRARSKQRVSAPTPKAREGTAFHILSHRAGKWRRCT
mmetsp:Transcript_5330/g.6207  ORF Transcript_5330/g.6207 Transcript_5330/m.6207 type:complete len:226 (+) Transcript_5330:273-950(+)